METIPVTVGILAYNSAATLERALQSVAGAAEILVADGGSTDATRAIAERMGAKVVAQAGTGPIRDFAAERNALLDRATQPWFLALDSDETASPELMAEIAAVARQNGAPLVCRIPMGITFDGREITAASTLPGYQFRFFAVRSGARWAKPIHEKVVFPPQDTRTLTGKWHIHWDAARLRGGFPHLEEDAAYAAKQPLLGFLRHKILRNLLGIVQIAASVIAARCTTPWRRCAPLRMEWRRMQYKALHILKAVRARYA